MNVLCAYHHPGLERGEKQINCFDEMFLVIIMNKNIFYKEHWKVMQNNLESISWIFGGYKCSAYDLFYICIQLIVLTTWDQKVWFGLCF